MSGAADHYSYVPTLEKGDVAALEEPNSSGWSQQVGPSPMKEAKEKLQQVHRQLGSVKVCCLGVIWQRRGHSCSGCSANWCALRGLAQSCIGAGEPR